MNSDPYSTDIFSGHARRKPVQYPTLPAEPGLVVEVRATGDVGEIINCERTYDGDFVRLEDRRRNQRLFKLRPGAFLFEGKPVTLTRWVESAPPQRTHSNSGSRYVHDYQTQVARPSRIWVEGVHDAAIVEKVWGHDLRVEGVVVEYLEGLDHLPSRLAEFRPEPGRRVGVLADHLIQGSKETRLTQQVGKDVLVTGHPYIDIWQAVKPQSIGISGWPDVPYGEDWKAGVCRRLGWAHPQEGWHRVYNAVKTFRDLDSSLIGAVERLVDFVTVPELTKEDLA
ncbi:DUF3097 family protein [Corynebacterium poyangense]|uniref:DUF3097 family protein n=1 Tax=Corynebacterium poyangense TaxID=2684405 RepID=A0A7H0SNX0_9CORY|nr:DUF3097 domain-containing protein [Corynebacterium poyangense]MBZ8177805.1 DUF3097 family protein [Corynebacterium poyangense]QNQ90245.1 DUF3097 family protein [Corynebacterium poyangense]